MKTNHNSLSKCFALGLVAAAALMTVQAQPTLDQSVFMYKSAAPFNTGHRLKWKVLSESNAMSPKQGKITQYQGVSSQPWNQTGGWHSADSAFQDGDAIHHEPQLKLISLNF